MSVPGRIGIILIIALALVDALILASGAKQAAMAIETHAMTEQTTMRQDSAAHQADGAPALHTQLLSKALQEISALMTKRLDKCTRI